MAHLRFPRRTAAVALLATAIPLASVGAASAKPAPEFDEQVLFAQHTDGYYCFRIPAIVQALDGTLLAFAEGRVNGCGDKGDIDLVLKRSMDGGRTWGPLQVVLPGNGDTRGNPAPVVDRRTGRIVLMTTWNPGNDDTVRHPFVQYSDDDGTTWSAARDLTSELVKPEWNSWYATGPGHALQLQHGPHKGRLIVAANHEGDGGALKGGPQGGHLNYSDDGGLTWKIGADDTRRTNDVSPGELSATELPDGRIYVNARDNTGTDPGNRNTATSSDGGLTFDRPFRTLPKLTAPKVQGSVLSVGKRVYLSVPDHPVTREIMAVRASADDGRNFQKVGKVIYWGPSAYSDLASLGGDRLGLLYEAGQAGPYEQIRFARFNTAYLATPNGTPPGLPKPPQPGPTTPDGSGHHNDGYVRGGMTAAGDFDGVDDFVQVPWDRSLDLGAGDFTWSARIRYADTSGNRTILWAYRVGSGAPEIWLRAEPGSKRIRGFIQTDQGSVAVATTQAYNDGQWHDVVLRRSGGRLSLTVDGQAASVAAPTGSVTEGKQFTIDGIDVGQRLDGVDRFHGSIADVRVYSRAVPDGELATARRDLRLWLPLDRIDPEGTKNR
ncbi:exo-alpha-sialidase [Actinoallomurus rhizosphaericola]|uniref:exo-alpha-sialidase n=1 Tax=Actinoallomurus rhizosphaericola TaxID=2952536 RepID=UPI00209288F2|nr:exo-alpha-sialidase [Actinoallomurus rhizosphaericola]MCO5997312.1 exo-alpha-sialidase [Actinoallomurus rhizosphaericola]